MTIETDNYALQRISQELQRSAATVGNHVKDVRDHDFGPAQAGRNYSAQGTAVHEGLTRIGSWLDNWRQAVAASAVAMNQGVVNYQNADTTNASNVAGVGR